MGHHETFELATYDPFFNNKEISLPPAEILPAFPLFVPTHHQGNDSDVVSDHFLSHPMVKSLLPCDVIFGKGNRLSKPGNINYRAACQRLVHRFLANPTAKVKEATAIEIMNCVQGQGGRFLEDGDRQGEWRVATYASALKKTKQLLTDSKKKAEAKSKPMDKRKKGNQRAHAVRSGENQGKESAVMSSDELTSQTRRSQAAPVKEASAGFYRRETGTPLHHYASTSNTHHGMSAAQNAHFMSQNHQQYNAVEMNGQIFGNPPSNHIEISLDPCFMGSVRVDLNTLDGGRSIHLNMVLSDMMKDPPSGDNVTAQQDRSAVNISYQFGELAPHGEEDLAHCVQHPRDERRGWMGGNP